MFEGVTVAIVTPWDNGKIDEKKYKDLIEFHIKQGTDTLLPCGTTGESATLTHDEQKHLIKLTCDIADKRIKIMAGTGSNSTSEAINLTKFAKDTGADGALLITPYYNKPTQNGMIKHYEAIADAVDIPMVIYNVPGRTGVSIAPETVAYLYDKIDNIIAIKEASGSLEQVCSILQLCDIMVLSGDDSLILPMMSVGAKGVVSVAANILPAKISEMIAAFNAKDIEEARQIHYELLPIFNVMFVETNPIPVKTSLHLMGMINKEFRLPLCELKPESEETLKKVLKEGGII